MSVFDNSDLFILNYVVAKYGNLSGSELANLTHVEAPYQGTKIDEDISFEYSFYRGTDFDDALTMPSMKEFLLDMAYNHSGELFADVPSVVSLPAKDYDPDEDSWYDEWKSRRGQNNKAI
jgi:hypothetical protein